MCHALKPVRASARRLVFSESWRHQIERFPISAVIRLRLLIGMLLLLGSRHLAGHSGILFLLLAFVFTLSLFKGNLFFKGFPGLELFLALLSLGPPVTDLLLLGLGEEAGDCGFTDSVSRHLLEAGKGGLLQLEGFELRVGFQTARFRIVLGSRGVRDDRCGQGSLSAAERTSLLR